MILPRNHPLLCFVRDQLALRRDDVARRFACEAEWDALPHETRPDLITAALNLQPPDLAAKLAAVQAVLKEDGLFLGAIIGGDSLRQLRACLLEAECAVTGGAALRFAPLEQPQDLAMALAQAGFSLPVVDVERVELDYAGWRDLLRDLRLLRARRYEPVRPFAPSVWREALSLYSARMAGPNGGLKAAVDIIFLHGWKS